MISPPSGFASSLRLAGAILIAALSLALLPPTDPVRGHHLLDLAEPSERVIHVVVRLAHAFNPQPRFRLPLRLTKAGPAE